MENNLIQNIIKELQNKGKIEKKEELEELITNLHRINNDIVEIKNKNEELNNRFGLFWKEVPEKMIKNISDKEIVYGKYVYSFVTKIENGEGKTINANINNNEIKLNRQADSYLFKDSEDNEFLVFSDSIYAFSKETEEEYIPILKEKGKDFFIGKNENNILIEGDNYYALQILQYTHKEKINIIYIDPPYNTGNRDFKYNDKFVKDTDSDKHSAWLSFMNKRLLLAKTLLSETGFIAIQINDTEHANLKLLCDRIFDEKNRVNDISVKMSELSGVKMAHSANGNRFPKTKESILIYAKNIDKLEFVLPKKDKNDELGKYIKYYTKIIKNPEELPEKWEILSLQEYGKIFKIKINNDFKIKNSHRIIYRTNNKFLENFYQKNPDKKIIEVISPKGIKYISWEGKEMLFLKNYLKEYVSDIWNDISTININKESGDAKTFKNGQKPIKLLKRIINLNKNKDIIILDFFAGSGSTGHAVWDLNKEDKGNRSFILCTNNENNICEDITFKRLKSLINKKYDYNESLKYLTIKHVSEKIIRKEDYKRQFETLKQIVNLKYNSFKIVEENDNWFTNENIAILKNFDYIEEFKLKFLNHNFLGIVTNEDAEWNIFKENLLSVKRIESLVQFSSSYMNEIRKVIKGGL